MMLTYPIVLRNYLFALGIFAVVPTASEAFSQGSIGGLDYVNFMMDEFSLLNITSLGRNLLDDQSDCGFACLEIPSCISYNVAAFPDINGKVLCELLPSDKYNNSDKFIPSQHFHHFSIPSPCSNSPCKNGGKCVSLYQENSYKCLCKEGFTGKNCEININECESSPCLNDGTCTDRVNGFNCTCPPGFDGNRCETDINECESSPCLNNGTCTDRVNEFNCTCPPGFAGNRCETDINECDSSPCLNNGTCTDRVNGFNCTCPPGFVGNRCNETAVMFNSTLAQFLAPVVGNNATWVLCYRATTHGWAASTFHRRCDGKPNTVTIITNGLYVFGGYTDVAWVSHSGNKAKYNAKSFIFSLRNKEGLPPFKSNLKQSSPAIYCYSSYGPTFGGGHDINIANNANSNSDSYANFGHSYSLPSGVKDSRTILAGTYNFSPDEVEVFYLG